MKKIIKLLSILAVFLVALWLRRSDYAQIPTPGQSVDEYGYSWMGMSLIELGMPVGISGMEGYKEEVKRYVNVDRWYQVVGGDALEINYPWMDHPPLMGLLTGGYAYLAGARNFEEARTVLIRRPVVVMGAISVVLAMVFAWINFGFVTGLMTGLIYATVPLVVLSSRMIQAENGVIPCLLAVMIMLSHYRKNNSDWWLAGAGIVSGVAMLFKLSGVVCLLVSVMVIWDKYKKVNKKFLAEVGFLLAFSLPIAGWFVIYGMIYDWEVFVNLLKSNYGRFYGIGPNVLMELIRNQRLTQYKSFPEVWILAGWLVNFVWLTRRNNQLGDKIVIWGLWIYLAIYIFFGSQQYGWYAFPFWPLLLMLVARCFGVYFETGRNGMMVWLMGLLLVGEGVSRVVGLGTFQGYVGMWRWGVMGWLMLGLLGGRWRRWVMGIVLLVVIYLNLKYLSLITVDWWWKNVS